LLKILNPHAVLYRGLAYTDAHFGNSFAKRFHPIVLAKDGKGFAYGFIKRRSGDLDRVIIAGKIAAGDLARAKGHVMSLARSPFIRLHDARFATPWRCSGARAWQFVLVRHVGHRRQYSR
jgi:hypothetical protein